jgi:5-formyltetrahydrofolate cyclo-ligase
LGLAERHIVTCSDEQSLSEKSQIREQVWTAIKLAGAGRFPGIRGRIPNFVGAEAAAKHLESTDEWTEAVYLKCNPDSPQRALRRAALVAGKTVFMAVPKLAEIKPFIMLDPALMDPKDYWRASSIKGAFELGIAVSVEEMPPIDLIVTGCVAVSEDGVRLGKGGGYSDLEYGLLRHFGKIHEATAVATSLHSVQLLESGFIPSAAHDISIDLVALPDGIRRFASNPSKPPGIIWDVLPDAKRKAIPVLRDWVTSDT